MDKVIIFIKNIKPQVWIIISIVLIFIIFLIIYFKNKNKTLETTEIIINKPTFPLNLGSKGSEVTSLQKFLNSVGTTPKLIEDGIWGSKTEKAYNDYFKSVSGSLTQDFYDKNIKGKF